MKRAILPLMLSAVIAPASHAAIYLNSAEITDFDISHSGGNVYITTSGGGVTPPTEPTAPTEPEPTEPTPPPPVDSGSCSAESQDLVFENLNWASQGPRVTVPTSTNTVSTKFTTTNSSTYAGYILTVQTTGTGGVTRRVWISACPGGAPLEDVCEGIGVDTKVTWYQGGPSKYCDLNRNTTYYINYRNLDGRGDTYRVLRNNGQP